MAGLVRSDGRAIEGAPGPGGLTAEQRYLLTLLAAYLGPVIAEGVPLDAEVSIAAVMTDLLDLAAVPVPAPIAAALATRTASVELVRQLTDAAGVVAPATRPGRKRPAIAPGWR